VRVWFLYNIYIYIVYDIFRRVIKKNQKSRFVWKSSREDDDTYRSQPVVIKYSLINYHVRNSVSKAACARLRDSGKYSYPRVCVHTLTDSAAGFVSRERVILYNDYIIIIIIYACIYNARVYNPVGLARRVCVRGRCARRFNFVQRIRISCVCGIHAYCVITGGETILNTTGKSIGPRNDRVSKWFLLRKHYVILPSMMRLRFWYITTPQRVPNITDTGSRWSSVFYNFFFFSIIPTRHL